MVTVRDNDVAPSPNTAPTFDGPFPITRAIAEDADSDAEVGAPVPATDTDSGDTLEYSKEAGGTGSALFNVDSDGQITLINGDSLNFETAPSYTLMVGVTDNKDASGQEDTMVDNTIEVVINVTDVNEAPTFDNQPLLTTINVAENTIAVGAGNLFAATDPDATDTTVTYSVAGIDAASFAISTTGTLTFNNAPDFENPQGGLNDDLNTYQVTVMATGGTSGRALMVTHNLMVTVTDEREEPNSFTISTGAVTSTSIVINWNEATTTGPPIDQYIIYITNVVTNVEENRVVPSTDDRTYTYTITGLLPATRYEILTEAEADEGSSFSNRIEVTTEGPAASISAAAPTTITEGEVATFTVTLDSAAPAGGLTISVGVTDSGSYISPTAPETVFIAEGATTGTLAVMTADDTTDEPAGSITATINMGTGYTVGTGNTAMVTVLDDDDPAASISADPPTITEGATVTFTVTLSTAAPAGGLTINVAVTESGSYISLTAPATVVIAGGATTVTLAVSTEDDSLDEPDGSITARITTGADYTVGSLSTATVTVDDNDIPDPDAPVASITATDPTPITEGDVATFTVTLDSAAPAGGLTIAVDVTDSGSYISLTAPETVFIADGATTGTLAVSTEDDSLDEPVGIITAEITAPDDAWLHGGYSEHRHGHRQ